MKWLQGEGSTHPGCSSRNGKMVAGIPESSRKERVYIRLSLQTIFLPKIADVRSLSQLGLIDSHYDGINIRNTGSRLSLILRGADMKCLKQITSI